MGEALLMGWLHQRLSPITVVEPKPSSVIKNLARNKRISLAATLPGKKKFSVCVIAVKPQTLKSEAGSLTGIANSGALMISIAAGTPTKFLSGIWSAKARIIRAMPNTPGAIGHGITGLFAAKGITAADRKRAEALLAALGETLWVKDEGLIDVVTAVSGSGPAYLFLMAEALTEAGLAEGLSKAEAEKLARATVSGAGALLAADKSPAAALRQAVTSPGGTTEAALEVLMANDGLVSLMKRAVHAARKRAEELR
jgi:pyrroline-5-carboxylate reductase